MLIYDFHVIFIAATLDLSTHTGYANQLSHFLDKTISGGYYP